MRSGAKILIPVALALALCSGIARADALLMNVQFTSGLAGTVSLGSGSSMLLTPSGAGGYELTSASLQDLVFQNGPLQIWPAPITGAAVASASDVYAQLAQMLLSVLPAQSFVSGQYLLGSLNASVLGETPAPLVGVVFVRPAGSSNSTPFNYIGGFEFPAGSGQSGIPGGNPVGEAPEPAAIFLLGSGLAACVLARRFLKPRTFKQPDI